MFMSPKPENYKVKRKVSIPSSSFFSRLVKKVLLQNSGYSLKAAEYYIKALEVRTYGDERAFLPRKNLMQNFQTLYTL